MRSIEECELIIEKYGDDQLLNYLTELFWLKCMWNKHIINDQQYDEILMRVANRYVNKMKLP